MFFLIMSLWVLASFNVCVFGNNNPQISIITSMYDGDLHIKGFMEDIVRQTIFDQCELILINANSPGNEEEVIQKYVERYPNIIYKKLSYDPGIYGVWNMAIKMARGQYLTNANVDDRLAHDCYEIHRDVLSRNPHIDLVYSDLYVTQVPNETFNNHSAKTILSRPHFSFDELAKCCLPNNHPMWRRSFHDAYGFFDETFYISGDWEMWLRAASAGSQFLKIPQVLSLYYENPQGLSTNESGDWKKEFLRVYYTYNKE